MNKFVLGVLLILLVGTIGTISAVPYPPLVKPNVRDFAYDETRVVFRPLSILVDKETIKLGESATYTIDLTTTVPDSDYSDGSYQIQFFGGVFADKDGNVIESREFRRVYGSYSETFTVKPTKVGEYALVGIIIQYDQTYDSATSQWITSPEEILVKEAKKLTVSLSPPPPVTPGIIAWFSNAWQSILDFFSGLFGG